MNPTQCGVLTPDIIIAELVVQLGFIFLWNRGWGAAHPCFLQTAKKTSILDGKVTAEYYHDMPALVNSCWFQHCRNVGQLWWIVPYVSTNKWIGKVAGTYQIT